MPTTIKLKNSVTTTNAPSSLAQGEVAINITDKKVWVGNAATTPIQLLGAGGSASFGALTCTSLTNSGLTSGRVTYAGTGGLLTDSANMTFNGTTLTVADLTDSSLTVNRVVYAGTAGNLVNSANFTFNGTTVTMANDASISGLTVGKGNGAIGTNTAVGGGALGGSNTGTGANSAFGNSALQSNTSGTNNTGLGYFALQANTTGGSQVAVGYGALTTNTTGGANTALGAGALQLNTTASNSTALGYQAGLNTTTGGLNTFVGSQAGVTNVTGTQNTYIGRAAGQNTTSSFNTFVGDGSGYLVSSGSKNTVLGLYNGNQGGLDIRTASNYIVLSDGDGNPRMYIDNNAVAYFNASATNLSAGGTSILGPAATGSPRILVGHATGTASGGGYMQFMFNASEIGSITQNGTTGVLYNTSSDYRLKDNPQPLTGAKDFIFALQPKTWIWKADGSKGTGFIAHEAQTVATQSVAGEKDAVDKDGKPAYQSMQAGSPEIIANLVALVQELTKEVDSLKAQLNK